jgi:hypothetical protein
MAKKSASRKSARVKLGIESVISTVADISVLLSVGLSDIRPGNATWGTYGNELHLTWDASLQDNRLKIQGMENSCEMTWSKLHELFRYCFINGIECDIAAIAHLKP